MARPLCRPLCRPHCRQHCRPLARTRDHRHPAQLRFASALASAVAIATLSTLHWEALAQPTPSVVVTGRVLSIAEVAGFGGAALESAPMQAGIFGAELLRDAGVSSLAGLAKLAAGVSDAYNTEGYWSALTVRGFVIDNRANYRRDGLPISAETAIGLQNKERVEVLEGTSGIQAGTSAPGGIVNLVVKRPDGPRRDASIEWRQGGSTSAAVDLAERFGEGGRYGLRLNAAATTLRPQTRSADGSSHLLALAGDVRLSPDATLEAEIETSRQSQPSVPGFSLLGGRLPDAKAVDPRINLNNQPWSQPVVLEGTTGSLRWRQRLAGDWRFTAHGAVQELRSDDRVAFPFGCYDAGADVYYADRYCPDGSFDLYDYRSDGERRRVAALDLRLDGRLQTGGIRHDFSVGLQSSRVRERHPLQAYNYAGQGRIDASAMTPAAPLAADQNTNRDERSTEAYWRDRMQIAPLWELWAGLRHTRLDRESVRTDGSRAIAYQQSFTTPWLALSRRLDAATVAYASWGEGVETDVAPNRARYTNRGQPLPALKSRQAEAGIKHAQERIEASLIAFAIVRPLAADIGACDVDASCTRRVDGDARHLGIEAAGSWRSGAWTLGGSAMWLNAERRGASDPALNGLRPANVPARTLKLRAAHDLAAWPGLQLQAALVHEGPRMVLPDNSVEAPGWTRLDLGARLHGRIGGHALTWRLGLDNATDARAWRETPYQFGHSYLFPLAQRQWRMSVQAAL